MDITHKYYPKTLEQKLGYVTEECGEVLSAIGKSRRWGLFSVDHTDKAIIKSNGEKETNREWILRELQDLKVAISILEEDLFSMDYTSCSYQVNIVSGSFQKDSYGREIFVVEDVDGEINR